MNCYQILKILKLSYNTMIIYLRHIVQLSENDKNVVLSRVQSIYSRSKLDMESVEYVVENIYNSTIRHNNLWRKNCKYDDITTSCIKYVFKKIIYKNYISYFEHKNHLL